MLWWKRRVNIALKTTPLLTAAVLCLTAQEPPRQFPDTTTQIVVFSDQLNTSAMTEGQFQFAATHYAGSQKLPRDATRRLRGYNPNYLVLHYRLGQGLGYRTAGVNCQPAGNFIQIIDGNSWIQEWPGDGVVQPNWFFQWAGQPRVYGCDFGWYLMELNDPGWRAWWSAQVIQQLQNNENDGVFADSYHVPNYGFTWNPNLPVVDAAFESAWAQRHRDFTDYIRTQFAGGWKWIPNIGNSVTTRDPSDYSNVDGVMVEQFASWGRGRYFSESDWRLQLNRTLSLVALDKIVIAQNYPNQGDINERMFMLGTYLLIKGARTYVNLLGYGQNVQWLPEYSINLGAPSLDSTPANISLLLDPAWNAYVRHYQNGIVVVNPSTTATAEFPLDRTYLAVTPEGGGVISGTGIAPGRLTYQTVNRLSLCGHCAAVLLTEGPVISSGGVVNAASGIGAEVAPGQFVAIYGTGLGPPAPAVSSFVEKGLGGARVFFDDTEAYLSYSSYGQVHAVVPYGLPPGKNTAVRVEYGSQSSTSVTLRVSGAAPGIFTMDGSGTGQAVVVNQNSTFNSPSNPAPRGSVVALWVTGQGLVYPAGADGQPPVTPPYPAPLLGLRVILGARELGPEAVAFAGLTYLGVMQVNVTIPADAPTGPVVEFRIKMGPDGAASRPGVTLAIE